MGSRTGPLTRRSRSLARLIKSAQTIISTLLTPSKSSNRLTLLEGLDVSRSKGDSDLVDLGGGRTGFVEIVFNVVGHFDR